MEKIDKAKRILQFSEIEAMNSDEIFEYVDDVSISAEQAENSEIDGDTDADDDKLYGNEFPSTRTSRSSLQQPSTSSAVDEEPMDWDSDDSVADPDYIMDDTPVKRLPFFNESDSSEDEDVQCDSVDDEISTNEPSNCYNWTKTAAEPDTYKKIDYTEESKPNFAVNFSSPIEIFAHFFTECEEQILLESERYALQHNAALNLSESELNAFLGILIITGFHKLPSIRMYWSTDANLQVPRISKIMSLRRFLQILRYLHVNDNEQMPKRADDGYDKLYKIRPLIKILTQKYNTSFTISRNASIDESMVGFKGRSSLKQYMPLKPTKRGFKIWALSCAETGYLYNFIVYEGKSDSKQEGSLGERTVLDLSEPLKNTGRCLYFDNFFSSIPLMTKLLSLGFFACGTFRVNRKFYPKDELAIDKQLKMGDSDFAQCNDISVVKWRDRGSKPVVIISNFHNPADKDEVSRTNKQGIKEIIKCPAVIKDYNKFMGGVDHFDQLIECYSVSKKSRRWWVKLFYYFLDTAIVNSYILHCHERKKTNKKVIAQLEFRSILANQLIGEYQRVSRRGPQKVTKQQKIGKLGTSRPVTVSNTKRQSNVGLHLPSKGTYRRCAFCSTKKNVKRSNVICAECDVALCLTCYKPFHEK